MQLVIILVHIGYDSGTTENSEMIIYQKDHISILKKMKEIKGVLKQKKIITSTERDKIYKH